MDNLSPGSGEQPRVRPATAADAAGVQGLIGQVFAEYNCVLNVAAEDTHLQNPGPWFRARGGEFWVVEERGRILACVGVIPYGDAAELKSLYVQKGWRRRGWGRRLSELALDFGRGRGCRRALLWSDTRFLAAHRLYEGLGFQRGGERELHDSNDTREYEFARPFC